MSSTTRLLVLGVVRVFQPVHGYEVRRELLSWRAQEWASVKPGSIYNALKTLTAEGYLEVVGTDQIGGRPERTTYRLTAVGDEEFRALLRETWWNVQQTIDPLMAAVSFLGVVARDEAIAALEQRMVQIRGLLRHDEFVINAHDGVESPMHVREMMWLMNARLASELPWAEKFIARLKAGEYVTLGDPSWRPTRSKEPEKPARGRPSARERAERSAPEAVAADLRSRTSARRAAAKAKAKPAAKAVATKVQAKAPTRRARAASH